MKACRYLIDDLSISHFVFSDEKDDTLFTFSVQWPQYNTVTLCRTSFGVGDDKIIAELKPVADEDEKQFNKIYNKQGNLEEVRNLLVKMFDTTKEEINDSLRLDESIADMSKEMLKKWAKKRCPHWNNPYNSFAVNLRDIYFDVRHCMQLWNNDKDRVTAWMMERGIERQCFKERSMIDIREVDNQTRRFLLREFYHWWGKELDSIIDKVAEKYPEYEDFDKAYYMCKKLLDQKIEDRKKKADC